MSNTIEIDLKPSLDNRYVQKTEEITVTTVLTDDTVKTYKFYGYEVIV